MKVKKRPIEIVNQPPKMKCPECGELMSMSARNFFEKINDPKQHLIICDACKSEYVLILKNHIPKEQSNE